MLGPSDREFVCGVKVDDLRDGVERRAVLSQHVLSIFALGELHVHEALAASVRKKGDKRGERVGEIPCESEKGVQERKEE